MEDSKKKGRPYEIDFSDPSHAGKSKKAIKKEAKKAFFEATKDNWLKLKKEKALKKKEKKREKRLAELGSENQKSAQKEGQASEEVKEPKKKLSKREARAHFSEALSSAATAVIDVAFEDLHDEKSRFSLAAQLSACSGLNKSVKNPLNLYITGLGPKTLEALKPKDHLKWLMKFCEEDYLQLFDPQSLVYLTGDSPNTLEDFDPKKVYIIGGIVDRNRFKNLTLDKANDQNIATARLPISAHVKLATSAILTINQCYEIILRKYNGESWLQAITKAIPARKITEVFHTPKPENLAESKDPQTNPSQQAPTDPEGPSEISNKASHDQ